MPAPNRSRRRLAWLGLASAGGACAIGLGVVAGGLRLGAPLVMLGLGGITLGLTGYAAFRMIDALWREPEADPDIPRDPGRRRDLEREKQAVLKAIKEIDLDHQMRKISDEDHRELVRRYRAKALRLIAELEAGDNYRALIEYELKARLSAMKATQASQAGVTNSAREHTSSGASAEKKVPAREKETDGK